jgi:hypothetical protein
VTALIRAALFGIFALTVYRHVLGTLMIDLSARTLLGFGLALSLSLAPLTAVAQTTAPKVEVQLTPDEIKEKEQRKACKIALCSAFLLKQATGPAVSCNVLKTWRKEQLTKMVSKGGVSWPWGGARCTADLKFKRADLVKAVSLPEYELAVDKHNISCELDREPEKYEVKMEIAPKVQFRGGKAVKAQMNWGKVDAPLLAKSVLWSATAADNTFGALQSTVVEDINDFVDVKCLEVKDDVKPQ